MNSISLMNIDKSADYQNKMALRQFVWVYKTL